MKTLLAVACALFLSACGDDAKKPVDAAVAKPDVAKVDAKPAADIAVDAAPAVDAVLPDVAVDAVVVGDAVTE
jgi:PBP1b-binding outer membrane lipoprotein LpoB